MLKKMSIFGLLLAIASVVAVAEEDKETNAQKATIHKLKREQTERASAIGFNKELGLAFDSLELLGTRIDQARKSPDPVGLANAANELAIAEKVAGRKATLAAAELWNEAVELAERRANSAELKALSYMVSDESAAKKLAKQAVIAEKREKELAAVKPGEESKGIGGNLRVVNHSNEIAAVYINGIYAGTLYPGNFFDRYVGLPWGTTVVEARGNFGGYWRKEVAQPEGDVLFDLTP